MGRKKEWEGERSDKKSGEQHGLAYMPPVAWCQSSRGMRSTRSLRYRLKVGKGFINKVYYFSDIAFPIL